MAESWWSRQAGAEAVSALARRRLAELVEFARRRSRFFRQLYAGLPRGESELARLPPVTKAALMANFDAWVTDPQVHRSAVEGFLADSRHIGGRFRDRYLVWKSSGSTGTPGIFLQDLDAVSIYHALVALHWAQMSGTPGGFFAGVGRAAIVVATGDHYASIASWERLRQGHPAWNGRSFSVLAPLAELVEALNEYRPTLLASYPSMLDLLAGERSAGRLRIEPGALGSGGELLAPADRRRIEHAFGCPVVDEYGASECLSIAHGCREGWQHVNADWVIVEGVEEDGSPTPPGRLSHTTLLTNLANRVQPLIRYDLGDRIVASAAACSCGNPMPAIRVQGRSDDMLVLASAGHGRQRLSPLALATVIEESSGVHRFQLAQVGAERLVLRFEKMAPGERRSAGQLACAALGEYLARQGLPNVRVSLDRRPPRVHPRSGKLRSVVIEAA